MIDDFGVIPQEVEISVISKLVFGRPVGFSNCQVNNVDDNKTDKKNLFLPISRQLLRLQEQVPHGQMEMVLPPKEDFVE